jgi:hypothetical protein
MCLKNMLPQILDIKEDLITVRNVTSEDVVIIEEAFEVLILIEFIRIISVIVSTELTKDE